MVTPFTQVPAAENHLCMVNVSHAMPVGMQCLSVLRFSRDETRHRHGLITGFSMTVSRGTRPPRSVWPSIWVGVVPGS